MRLSIIVAMARNRVIGRDDTLPWRLSADLKRFKSLTMGHHLIMGRKTFESLPRLLPGRTSLVISRTQEPGSRGHSSKAERAGGSDMPLNYGKLIFTQSLEGALTLAAGDPEVFVIGGAQIYELALPRADRLYVTHVEADVAGDTFFPIYDEAEWRRVEETVHAADTKNEHPHRYCIYDRIRPSPSE
ncbi:MAG: dihydrofolate reductase [Pirellulaceae bacterium]